MVDIYYGDDTAGSFIRSSTTGVAAGSTTEISFRTKVFLDRTRLFSDEYSGPDDYWPTEGSGSKVIASLTSTTSGQYNAIMSFMDDGYLLTSMVINTDTAVNISSTEKLAEGTDVTIWLRVDIDPDNGSSQSVVTYYTSSDGTNWTQLGDAITSANFTWTYNTSYYRLLDATAWYGYIEHDGRPPPTNRAIARSTIFGGTPFGVYEAEFHVNGTLERRLDAADTTSNAPALVGNYTDPRGDSWITNDIYVLIAGDQTVTVNPGGGADYTSISNALSDCCITTGNYTVQLTAATDYSISGSLGTEPRWGSGRTSPTRHPILESAPSVRHDGTAAAQTGVHARISGNSTAESTLFGFGSTYGEVADWTEFRYLAFEDNSVTRLFRLRSGQSNSLAPTSLYCSNHVHFSRCVFLENIASGSTTLIEISGEVFDVGDSRPWTMYDKTSRAMYIDHCVILGFERIIDSSSTADDAGGGIWRFWIDHCAWPIAQTGGTAARIIDMGSPQNGQDGKLRRLFYMNNTWFGEGGGFVGPSSGIYPVYYFDDADARENLRLYGDVFGVGSPNKNPFRSVDSQTPGNVAVDLSFFRTQVNATTTTQVTTTADAFIIEFDNGTPSGQDCKPALSTGGGSNLLLGTGSNRQGKEASPLQDFSYDIVGTIRTTRVGSIDLGPFQVSVPPPGFRHWNGSAFVESTSVKHWNGAAWVEVTSVKHWNGSAWVEPS